MFNTLLQAADPNTRSFTVLLIASEIGVTLIVFYGFYLVFNRFNNKLKKHRKDNPEITRNDD
jgi:hypothetical protein